LHGELSKIPEVKILFPRQANAVFAELPMPAIQALWDKGWKFYTFIGVGGCRLMCAWDTQPEDVHDFVLDLKQCLKDPVSSVLGKRGALRAGK
jgi:threonine aldolase